MTGIKTVLFAGAWVFCAAALTGCYGDIKDLCEKAVKCEGGNEADEKACVEELKGERDAAKEYDCKDEWDEAYECYVDNGSCQAESGYDYFTSNGQCDNLWDSLENCEDAASAWN